MTIVSNFTYLGCLEVRNVGVGAYTLVLKHFLPQLLIILFVKILLKILAKSLSEALGNCIVYLRRVVDCCGNPDMYLRESIF